jgi:hypothetical protein
VAAATTQRLFLFMRNSLNAVLLAGNKRFQFSANLSPSTGLSIS